MGWINTRGTRTNPRYVCYWHEGLNPDGSKRVRMARAMGATSKADAKKFLAMVESRVAKGEPGIIEAKVSTDMGELLETWAASLTNRTAQADRWIIARDLVPRWKGTDAEAVDVPAVIRWLDELRATSMSGQTQLHRYNLLSRFFGWATERGYAKVNPCASVKRGKRPRVTRDVEAMPWLEDDGKVRDIIDRLELAAPGLGLMFYLGRFTGMREGEVAGLRMGDLDLLGNGVIRVGRSFAGPLKEDKNDTGKTKMVPAPDDWRDVIGLHLKRRKLQGAKAEDLVFTYGPQSKRRKGVWASWAGFHPHTLQAAWSEVRKAMGLPKALTWYHATRTTYVSKALMAGASLDEVSAAIGHSSPVVTKRFYDRFVRTSYTPTLRTGLAGISSKPGQTG
jgi:integrase